MHQPGYEHAKLSPPQAEAMQGPRIPERDDWDRVEVTHIGHRHTGEGAEVDYYDDRAIETIESDNFDVVYIEYLGGSVEARRSFEAELNAVIAENPEALHRAEAESGDDFAYRLAYALRGRDTTLVLVDQNQQQLEAFDVGYNTNPFPPREEVFDVSSVTGAVRDRLTSISMDLGAREALVTGQVATHLDRYLDEHDGTRRVALLTGVVHTHAPEYLRSGGMRLASSIIHSELSRPDGTVDHTIEEELEHKIITDGVDALTDDDVRRWTLEMIMRGVLLFHSHLSGRPQSEEELSEYGNTVNRSTDYVKGLTPERVSTILNDAEQASRNPVPPHFPYDMVILEVEKAMRQDQII